MSEAAVRCKDCGNELPDPPPDNCPSCGGTRRAYSVNASATVHVSTEVSYVLIPGLAQAWWADVVAEAVAGRDARRRQIVFGGAFLETYLYEWVRDVVLVNDPDRWDRLDRLFPVGDSRNVVQRWKQVPKALAERGAIQAIPDLGVGAWEEIIRLLTFRNGLLHGTSSPPVGSAVPEGRVSPASVDVLASIGPGWVPSTVVSAVDLLLSGTASGVRPEWMRWPTPILPNEEE